MSEMYTRIEELCKQRGINITQMCTESGATRGALTDLKMGRTVMLSTKTLKKISVYFDVSMEYLLGTEKEKKPSADNSEELLNNEIIERLISLTPAELEKVDAFVQGLLASR